METEHGLSETPAPSPVQQCSFLRCVIGTFLKPTEVFSSIKYKPRWGLPFILVVVFLFSFEIVTLPYKLSDYIENTRQDQTLSQEEVQRRIEMFEAQRGYNIPTSTAATGAIILTVMQGAKLFGLTLLIWLIAHLFTPEQSYVRILSLCSLAYLVTIPEMILKALMVIGKGTTYVSLSAVVLLPDAWEHSPVYRVLRDFDFFTVWFAVLLVIGLPIVTGMTRRQSFLLIGGFALIQLLLSAFNIVLIRLQ